MKKSNIGTMQKAGAGLYVATTSEPGKSKKPTPNNEGKSYHKWTMQQRDLLLRECLFQQVWTAPHKQKQQTWSNICIILNNLPNIGDEFATVDWRKCQDEFTKNVEFFFKRNNIPTNPIAFSCIFAPANAPFPIHGNPEFHKKTICGKKFHKLDLWKN